MISPAVFTMHASVIAFLTVSLILVDTSLIVPHSSLRLRTLPGLTAGDATVAGSSGQSGAASDHFLVHVKEGAQGIRDRLPKQDLSTHTLGLGRVIFGPGDPDATQPHVWSQYSEIEYIKLVMFKCPITGTEMCTRYIRSARVSWLSEGPKAKYDVFWEDTLIEDQVNQVRGRRYLNEQEWGVRGGSRYPYDPFFALLKIFVDPSKSRFRKKELYDAPLCLEWSLAPSTLVYRLPQLGQGHASFIAQVNALEDVPVEFRLQHLDIERHCQHADCRVIPHILTAAAQLRAFAEGKNQCTGGVTKAGLRSVTISTRPQGHSWNSYKDLSRITVNLEAQGSSSSCASTAETIKYNITGEITWPWWIMHNEEIIIDWGEVVKDDSDESMSDTLAITLIENEDKWLNIRADIVDFLNNIEGTMKAIPGYQPGENGLFQHPVALVKDVAKFSEAFWFTPIEYMDNRMYCGVGPLDMARSIFQPIEAFMARPRHGSV